MPKPRFLSLEPEQQRHILRMAAQEFLQSGLEGASMNQIIANCGISKGAMYYYFDGKEDLYRTVLSDNLGELRQALGPVPGPEHADAFWEILRGLFDRALRWFRQNPDALTLFHLAITPQPNQDGAPIGLEDLNEHLATPISALLHRAQERGVVRQDLPPDLLLQILYLAANACSSWLIDSTRQDEPLQQARLESVTSLLQNALQAHAPTAAEPAPAEPAPAAPEPAAPAPAEPTPLVAPATTTPAPGWRHLRALGDQLWIVDGGYVVFMGIPLPTRMTVARLENGELWLHSPVLYSDTLAAELEALGPITHLVAPNNFHHLFLKEWQQRYPKARLYAAPKLPAKRRDLRFDAELGDQPEPPWEGQIDQVLFRGSLLLSELAFYHRPARALIVTDLIMNLDPRSLPWPQRAVMSALASLAPHGATPRELRLTFRDRARARACLEQLFDWDFDKVIMSHGLPVERNARAFTQRAFSWLRG